MIAFTQMTLCPRMSVCLNDYVYANDDVISAHSVYLNDYVYSNDTLSEYKYVLK